MTGTTAAGRVFLKPRHAKPAYMHHPWVFASAVDRLEGDPPNGALVSVHDNRGRFIAQGFLSTHSDIRVRLVSWDPDQPVDRDFWARRIRDAAGFRQHALRLESVTDAWRVVNSEGDGIPGLLVDRYGPVLVIQFTTFPMAQLADLFVELLADVLKPVGIYEKADGGAQKLEGFSRPSAPLAGTVPETDIELREGPARFLVNLAQGHKTGFYLDQRENRLHLAAMTAGLRVLDCFTYTGAFAVHAALGGAAEVLAIDSSAPALEAASRQVDFNRLSNVELRRGDVFETLRLLAQQNRLFDVIILDPPKLARHKKGLERALAGYKDLNLSAMKLLRPDGLLVTCSCSGLVGWNDFLSAVNAAAVDANRMVRPVIFGRQAPDHAVTTAFHEGNYLKCLFARVQ